MARIPSIDVPLNRVMAYSHPGLVERLQDKLGITEEAAIDLFDDMKRFLYLCAVTPGPLAPSGPIDEAWHHFILHTADYRLFCHRSCSGASSTTRRTRARNARARTIQRLSGCAPLLLPHSVRNYPATGMLTRGCAEVAKTPSLVAAAVKTAARRLLVAVKKNSKSERN